MKALCECILNELKETVPTSSSERQKLVRNKRHLITLADKKIPLNKKKKAILQNGRSFLRVILPPVFNCISMSYRTMNHAKRMVVVPEYVLANAQIKQSVETSPLTQKLSSLGSDMEHILQRKHLSGATMRKYSSITKHRKDTFSSMINKKMNLSL